MIRWLRHLTGQRTSDLEFESWSWAALLDRLLEPLPISTAARVTAAVQARYMSADAEGKLAFLNTLADGYNADPGQLDEAIDRYRSQPGPETLAALHARSEPRRQQLLRRFNELPGGTAMLLEMRRDTLRLTDGRPGFQALDSDFKHLFASWFNGGFLVLRKLDWSTSGAVLAKLIDYEAVHEIGSWEELRARLEPEDRRCYGLFHPLLEQEPLIFIEVALTSYTPASIDQILASDRVKIRLEDATTAVFYSISNCQEGLRGIAFGGALIKQVVDRLKRELPGLTRAVTLSPMPGFAAWLRRQADEQELLAQVDGVTDLHEQSIQERLRRTAARYLLTTRGRDVDPVARFHLGNGARVERLNPLGDRSARGMKQSFGMMVNYLYDPATIERNHRSFSEGSQVAASGEVRRLVRTDGNAWPWSTGKGKQETA